MKFLLGADASISGDFHVVDGGSDESQRDSSDPRRGSAWDRLPACRWCCLTGWKPIPRVNSHLPLAYARPPRKPSCKNAGLRNCPQKKRLSQPVQCRLAVGRP